MPEFVAFYYSEQSENKLTPFSIQFVGIRLIRKTKSSIPIY